jgi:hypothetical protein
MTTPRDGRDSFARSSLPRYEHRPYKQAYDLLLMAKQQRSWFGATINKGDIIEQHRFKRHHP